MHKTIYFSDNVEKLILKCTHQRKMTFNKAVNFLVELGAECLNETKITPPTVARYILSLEKKEQENG